MATTLRSPRPPLPTLVRSGHPGDAGRMASHDLVIRGGTVIDGTGAERRTADVAVSDGLVTEVGDVAGTGRREIDADGALVLPGFVDIHCHYDGQATWDERLQPSSWHGATTVVVGNCGVGFAPVKPTDHLRLVQLMEGVEDIPGTALHEGLSWAWSSFAEFLDAVDARPHDIDVATQVPHSPIRLFAMGERGADHEERSTPEEIAEMGRLAAEGIAAGALGFSTSRTMNHRTSTGAFTPTLTADRAELVGIAEAIGIGGRGVLQMVGDFIDLDFEFETLVEMMRVSGRPLSFSLAQSPIKPDQYRDLLAKLEAANRRRVTRCGPRSRPEPWACCSASTARCTRSSGCRRWPPIDLLPLPERVAHLSDPANQGPRARRSGRRRRSGCSAVPSGCSCSADPPDYEPGPDDSVAAHAARAGVAPEAWAYDRMVEGGGRGLFYLPFLNYADGNLDAVREMLAHPNTVPGLSDGGAHVGTICDASFPTFLLTHWGRDRDAGDASTSSTWSASSAATPPPPSACSTGACSSPGHRADLNVVDFDRLRSPAPRCTTTSPPAADACSSGPTGYRHTFVAGVETYADGEATGELPGRLVRGAQAPGA